MAKCLVHTLKYTIMNNIIVSALYIWYKYYVFPKYNVGVHYTPGEVANFQSLAHRAVGSPSEAIFQDFITRSLTSDDVYIVLKEMGHVAGMKILKDYGMSAYSL